MKYEKPKICIYHWGEDVLATSIENAKDDIGQFSFDWLHKEVEE